MKKTKLLFALTLMSLSLIGCNKSNNETTSSYANWTDNEKSYMNEAIGTTLPEGPFSDKRESGGYTDDSDGAYTFYMFDTGVNDVSNEYASILESNGYTSDGSDDSYGMTYYFYYKEISNSETDFIYVQFGYYPGDDDYEAGFDLYTWIYSESDYDYGDDDFDYETYTSWPEDTVNTFLNGATSVPAVEGTEYLAYIDTDEYGDYLCIMITTDSSNIEESYTATLTSAGWTIDDSEYDVYGLFATSSNEDVLLQYYYDDYFYGAFVLYISLF